MFPEPPGGAHTDYPEAARLLDNAVLEALAELEPMSPEELIAQRYEKFRRMGEPEGLGEDS